MITHKQFPDHHIFETDIGGRTFTVETGKVAELCNAECICRYGDTVVLVTAVASSAPKSGIEYFPLTIEFEERLYSVGRIPGAYLRREGRPSEKGILVSRLIDRPMRPFFDDDLRNDDILLSGLETEIALRSAGAALEDALQRAVARQTFIRLDVEAPVDSAPESGAGAQRAQRWEDWYFLNTVKGRQAAAMIRTGKLHDIAAVAPDEVRLRVERPNIFILYEQNVGMLTPLLADQLRDTEKNYPPDWIAEAFDIAVASNKRSLRYIQAILKRWETEGKNSGETHERDSAESRRRKYTPDELANYPSSSGADGSDPDWDWGAAERGHSADAGTPRG